MKTAAQLKEEIRQADAVLRSHKAPGGEAPPRPSRAVPGYAHGQATDVELMTAGLLWDQHWLAPPHIARAQRLRALAEAELTEVAEREEQDQEVRAEHAARLEERVKMAFFSNPAATEESWQRQRQRLVDEALTGESPVDQRKRELLASGRYQPL